MSMLMKSRVSHLAREKGVSNPSQLGLLVGITYPTASKIWNGQLDQTRGETLYRLAVALKCKMEDLFEVAAE